MTDFQPARRPLYGQQNKKEAAFDVLAIARSTTGAAGERGKQMRTDSRNDG